jgi:hypothetical protein
MEEERTPEQDQQADARLLAQRHAAEVFMAACLAADLGHTKGDAKGYDQGYTRPRDEFLTPQHWKNERSAMVQREEA